MDRSTVAVYVTKITEGLGYSVSDLQALWKRNSLGQLVKSQKLIWKTISSVFIDKFKRRLHTDFSSQVREVFCPLKISIL